MNKYYLISVLFFCIGLFFIISAFINNKAEFGFILFFPFIIGSGINIFLGFIFVFIAITTLFFRFANKYTVNNNLIDNDIKNNDTKKSAKFGGLILLGPIPIVFGSSWKITLIILFFGILVLITLLILLKPF